MSPSASAAALWMIGTIVSFVAMAVAIRELSESHHTFWILSLRSFVGLAALGVVVAFVGKRAIASQAPGWQIRRNLAHFLGQSGWTYGLGVLPLATVFTLEFTVPAWTALLAVLFLGERLSGARAVAVAGGIAGVLVILRPGLAAPEPAALVVLGAAVAYAAAHGMTKHLTRSDGVLAILFWMAAVQLPLALAANAAFGRFTWPVAADAPWIAVVGLAALGAHACLARALSLADAIIVLPLDFLRLPLIVLVAWALYGEALRPEVALGGAIILATLLDALRRER